LRSTKPPADAVPLSAGTPGRFHRAQIDRRPVAHASSQDEPRLGLGNVADQVLGDGTHVGELGAFLGEIDGDPATHCP